ncbi:MAG: PCMD domain-containing protein [Alloprevotella sp.]
MKLKICLALTLVTLISLTSCIRDEAANAECDITGVDSLWLNELKASISLIGEPIVKNSKVNFTIKDSTDVSAIAPVFYLTPGATISPANGTVRNFTTPQIYTIYSEDGNWSKNYIVSFKKPAAIHEFHFEHFALDERGQYYEYYEVGDDPEDKFDYWDSGNAGYALTGMGHAPEDYPTQPWAAGYRGNGVKLTTLSTGSWGKGVNMPIAAGNLFIGEFRVAQAMLFPRKATRFGRQLVTDRPLRLEGWYKYTAGPDYQDIKEVIHPELHDTCDIYAVLYEVDPQKFVALNGDDVLSSERIVSLARIDDPGEPQEWTHFSEPFKPCNGKEFDYERLANDGYAIAIVATSSRQGAYFEGAIGSTLYIDEISIVWENDEQ